MHTLGQNPSATHRLTTCSIGHSQENRPILLHQTPAFPAAPGGTLFIGGMHGDERATVLLLLSFQDRLQRSGRVSQSAPALGILPLANPDGYLHNTRYNARGVDLNRNCATGWCAESEEPSGEAPWSEPESRALRDYILQQRPARIVTLHWALAELDADGPQSTPLALAMWNALSEAERAPYRLRVAESEAVVPPPDACPGSLGQWCGTGLRYPDGTAPAIVTLELPYDPHLPRPAVLPDDHLARLRHAWKHDARGYLTAVEGSVHKMLWAACGQ
ncbi:MAG: M14 family zinc carboxypeptidase [Verrucomicrobiota bacterium]